MPTREETALTVKALSSKMDEALKRAETEIYCLGCYARDMIKKNSKYKDKSKHINQINGQLNGIVRMLETVANNYKDDNK